MALGMTELLVLLAGALCCLLVPAGIAVAVIVSRRSESDGGREGERSG